MKNEKTIFARSSGKSMKALDDLLRELSFFEDVNLRAEEFSSDAPPKAGVRGLKKPSMEI